MGELWGVFVRYMYKNDCDTSRVALYIVVYKYRDEIIL